MITWKSSPNFDTNRTKITTIVIHWFGEGTLESANNRFQSPEAQVSAHYGISNKRVWQWVKEEHVAYHCGNYPMNQRSIGIEHDATTSALASEETYETSAKLIADICRRYSIPIDRTHIIKHSEVKATQCCGTIDIDRLVIMAKNIVAPSDDQKVIDELRMERDRNWGLYQAEIVKREEAEKQAQQANIELNGTTAELQAFRGIIRHYATLLNCKESETEKMAGEIKRLIEIETIYQASESTIKNLNTEVEGLKANEVRLENDLTEIAKQKNDVESELANCRKEKANEGLAYYTWFTRFWSLFRIFFLRKRGE